MTIIYTIVFFLYGLVFGSFFNVVGLRVPLKESIVKPPSHCPNCQYRLRASDLIPVASYLFLRGKCRSCGTQIRKIYPLMELVTGLLFALSYVAIGLEWELVIALLFVSLLVIITVSDLAYMLIPDKVLLPFALALFLLRLWVPLDPWWDSLLGAIVGFGVLFFIALVSKGGMGGGDIKLFFVLGLALGTVQTLVTLFLAALIGTVIGFISLKRAGQGRKTPIPFGPSIALSAIIVYFYGEKMISTYMKWFF